MKLAFFVFFVLTPIFAKAYHYTEDEDMLEHRRYGRGSPDKEDGEEGSEVVSKTSVDVDAIGDIEKANLDSQAPKIDLPSYQENAAVNTIVIPKDIEEKMKERGILLVYFLQPEFLDVLDREMADLVWKVESKLLSKNAKVPIRWKDLYYVLYLQHETELMLKQVIVKATGFRNHGRYRIEDAKPGTYYVTVDAFRGVVGDMGNSKKVGHGRTFFFVHEYRISVRLHQFFVGYHDESKKKRDVLPTSSLRPLDWSRQKPGNKKVCFVPIPGVAIYRFHVYEISKNNFHRTIIVFNGNSYKQVPNNTPLIKQLMEINPTLSEADATLIATEMGSPPAYILEPTDQQYLVQEEELPKTPGPDETECYCFTYYFFKENNTVSESFVYIAATAWKAEGNNLVLHAWGRATIFGYWNKLWKNVLISISVAALFAGYVCIYIPMGPFAVWSTAATKGYVYIKIIQALYGTNEKCIW